MTYYLFRRRGGKLAIKILRFRSWRRPAVPRKVHEL